MRRSVLTLAAAALLASGCLTLQADVAIDANDTVSGEISFTADAEALRAFGEMDDGDLFDESDVTDVESELPPSTNARARLIDDEARIGLGIQLDGTPITELPALFTALDDDGDPFPLRFTVQRDGDLHRLSGNLGDGGAEMEMMGGITLDVSITFAGDVRETNGIIGEDGRTVTWTSGGPISATADVSGGVGGLSTLAIIAVIVVVLLVIVFVVVVLLRSRNSSTQSAPQQQQPAYPQQQQPAYPQQQQPAYPQQQQPAAPQPPQAAAPQPPQAAAQQPAGWYPDPWGQAAQRYWDGGQWTEHTG